MCHQTRSKELQKGHWRVIKGNAKHPRPGAREGASSPSCPLPFPAGAAAQGESPRGWGDGWPAVLITPSPPPLYRLLGLGRQLILPPSQHTVHLGLSFDGRKTGLVSRGVGRTWCEARSLLPTPNDVGSGGRAGSRRAAGTGVLTSPPQRLGVQVGRANPIGAGRAGPVDTPSRRVFAARREEAPERRLVLHGAGVPSGPAPRDAAGPRLRAPGPAHAVSRARELRPAAWQPQVRRQGSGSLSEPPSLRTRFCPSQRCEPHPVPNSVGFFGAGSVFFPFFLPVPRRRLPT